MYIAPKNTASKTDFSMEGGNIATFGRTSNNISAALYFEDEIVSGNMRGGLIYSNAEHIIGSASGAVTPNSAVLIRSGSADPASLGQTRVLTFRPTTGITKYPEGSGTHLLAYPANSMPRWKKHPLSAAVQFADGKMYLLPDSNPPEIYQFEGSAADVDYDGQPHSHGAAYSLRYIGIEGTNYDSTEAPREVGKYKISVTVSQQGEYAAGQVDDFKKFEIRAVGGNSLPGMQRPTGISLTSRVIW